jgi:hypothetical protein
MKKIVLGLLIVVSFYSNAQETKFVFDYKTGLNDQIVIPVEGKTATEIYKKTLDWIKVTYTDPSKAILSTIENEYIRFNGLGEYICYDALKPKNVTLDCYNVKYEIIISIKDGKYKFEILSIQKYETPRQYNIGGWINVPVFSKHLTEESLAKILFKKDGTIRKEYETITKSGDYFNNLNASLLEYITNSKSKSDW